MFKNLTIYRIAPGWATTAEAIYTAMDARRYVPIGSTQEKSTGWVEPCGEAHAPLLEQVAGQIIMKLMIETKSVPGATVREKAQAEADHIEQTTGRKPGKKEMRELREDALLALLPQAFPKKAAVWIWIDTRAGLLCIDATSQSKVDEVITTLVQTFDGMELALVQTTITPATAMVNWLRAESPDEWPEGFAVERECELKSYDEEKSTIKFNRHNLVNEIVRKHISEGKLPTKLAMSWEGRVSFVLTESMQIRKIEFLEGVFDDRAQDEEGGFDADVALATGELQKLIPALIGALGGEIVLGEKQEAGLA